MLLRTCRDRVRQSFCKTGLPLLCSASTPTKNQPSSFSPSAFTFNVPIGFILRLRSCTWLWWDWRILWLSHSQPNNLHDIPLSSFPLVHYWPRLLQTCSFHASNHQFFTAMIKAISIKDLTATISNQLFEKGMSNLLWILEVQLQGPFQGLWFVCGTVYGFTRSLKWSSCIYCSSERVVHSHVVDSKKCLHS